MHQVLARECYQAALASRENHTWMIDEPETIPEPLEVPLEIEVIPGDPSKALKMEDARLDLLAEDTRICFEVGLYNYDQN